MSADLFTSEEIKTSRSAQKKGRSWQVGNSSPSPPGRWKHQKCCQKFIIGSWMASGLSNWYLVVRKRVTFGTNLSLNMFFHIEEWEMRCIYCICTAYVWYVICILRPAWIFQHPLHSIVRWGQRMCDEYMTVHWGASKTLWLSIIFPTNTSSCYPRLQNAADPTHAARKSWTKGVLRYHDHGLKLEQRNWHVGIFTCPHSVAIYCKKPPVLPAKTGLSIILKTHVPTTCR